MTLVTLHHVEPAMNAPQKTATTTSAFPAPTSIPFINYGVVIDAGSSGSRIFVYRWETVADEEPLKIVKVFPSTPADEHRAVVEGGIQTKGASQVTMDEYLTPLLLSAKEFLQSQDPRPRDVPIYLLATGGMRSLKTQDQGPILDFAHNVISSYSSTFHIGTRATTTRVITGELEGLYGWVALNYGRYASEPIVGLQEMGGASIQIAFRDVSGRIDDMTRVCLLSAPEGHSVYSATWDGFGADTMRGNLLQLLSNEAGLERWVIDNPCLPRGEVGKPFGNPPRWSVGTGDFAACLKITKRLLEMGSKVHEGIPSYPDIKPSTNHFLGVSNYWYTYQFFGNWGGYDLGRVYDRQRFEAAAAKYCSHTWGELDVKVDKYVEAKCFNAAWMLTLLHDHDHGFGLEMTKYETWKGLFRFPTTPVLASRSSWTMGAIALVARHGGLKFCPDEDEEMLALSYNTSIYGQSSPLVVPHIDVSLPPSAVASVQQVEVPSSHVISSVLNPLGSAPLVVNVALLVVLIVSMVVISYRRLYHSRPSAVPSVYNAILEEEMFDAEEQQVLFGSRPAFVRSGEVKIIPCA